MLMIIIEALKLISLILTVRYTFVNFGRLYHGESISSANTLLMAVGISVFVYLQFILR